jgi:hypothetical protein
MDDFEEKLREAEEEWAEMLGMDLDEYLEQANGDEDGDTCNMYFDEGEEMEKLLKSMGMKNVIKENILKGK